MPGTKVKMDSMLFDHETTYRTDYHSTEIKAPALTLYKPKPTCMWIRPPPLKDVHTLSDWKAAVIPFDLLHKPKDILGTDPTKVQAICVKPPDLGRELAQKTRPRLVMTPAVSMDDIEDPKAPKSIKRNFEI